MAKCSCRISLETGEILESEILETDVEVDIYEFVSSKVSELLSMHKQANEKVDKELIV